MTALSRFPTFLAIGLTISQAGCVYQALPTAQAADEARQPPKDCPVTLPPDPPFVPPPPWPEAPPTLQQVWYGANDLWTTIPVNGTWSQLGTPVGDKVWWWSENYKDTDVATDWAPDLEVNVERLDALSPSFHTTEATNGFHPSFNQAMLVGVSLHSPGCWQFSARFQGSQLWFVVWVPPD